MGMSSNNSDKNMEQRLSRLPAYDLDFKVSRRILSRAHALMDSREPAIQQYPNQERGPGYPALFGLTAAAIFVCIDVIRIILFIYSM